MRNLKVIINYLSNDEINPLKTLLNISSDNSIPHYEGLKELAKEIAAHEEQRNAKQFFNEFSIMQQLWICEQIPQDSKEVFKQELIDHYVSKLEFTKSCRSC